MLVSSKPYNGVGPFYNGDMASDPSFDIRVGDTFSQGLQSSVASLSGASVARPYRQVFHTRREVNI